MKKQFFIAVVAITIFTGLSKVSSSSVISSSEKTTITALLKPIHIHIPLGPKNYINIDLTLNATGWSAYVDYYYNGHHYVGTVRGNYRTMNGKQVVDETTIEATYDSREAEDAFAEGDIISILIDSINENL